MEASFWPDFIKMLSELIRIFVEFKWIGEAWHLVIHPYDLVCGHGAELSICDHSLAWCVLAIAAVVGFVAAASHRSSH